jgi:hypothetical protein
MFKSRLYATGTTSEMTRQSIISHVERRLQSRARTFVFYSCSRRCRRVRACVRPSVLSARSTSRVALSSAAGILPTTFHDQIRQTIWSSVNFRYTLPFDVRPCIKKRTRAAPSHQQLWNNVEQSSLLPWKPDRSPAVCSKYIRKTARQSDV